MQRPSRNECIEGILKLEPILPEDGITEGEARRKMQTEVRIRKLRGAYEGLKKKKGMK